MRTYEIKSIKCTRWFPCGAFVQGLCWWRPAAYWDRHRPGSSAHSLGGRYQSCKAAPGALADSQPTFSTKPESHKICFSRSEGRDLETGKQKEGWRSYAAQVERVMEQSLMMASPSARLHVSPLVASVHANTHDWSCGSSLISSLSAFDLYLHLQLSAPD